MYKKVKKMTEIYIPVEVLAGASIERAAEAAVELADRTNTSVKIRFNGIDLFAHPDLTTASHQMRKARICEEYVRRFQLKDTY
jgi:hypothetical protein